MCLLNKYGAHPGPRPKSRRQCAETFSTLPFQCNFPAPSAESTSLGEKRFRRPPHLLVLPYRLLSPSPNHLDLSLNDAEPCSAPPDPTTWETQPPSTLAPAPPLRLGIEVAEGRRRLGTRAATSSRTVRAAAPPSGGLWNRGEGGRQDLQPERALSAPRPPRGQRERRLKEGKVGRYREYRQKDW